MDPADVKAYADRDWRLARELKDRYWATRKRTLRPEEALSVAENLRQQARALRPAWPGEKDREADLENHVRVAECLHRVRSPEPS